MNEQTESTPASSADAECLERQRLERLQFETQRLEDEQWMAHALALAAKADALNEVPVAAVVVLDGEIIGEGWNQPISACDPTAHAEVLALRAAALKIGNYRLPGATLYVTIEPCTMCAGALVHARVKRVVFGATEPKAGAVVSNSQVFEQEQLNHRIELCGGVCEAESIAAMQLFFKRRRREKKAARRAQKLLDTTAGAESTEIESKQ